MLSTVFLHTMFKCIQFKEWSFVFKLEIWQKEDVLTSIPSEQKLSIFYLFNQFNQIGYGELTILLQMCLEKSSYLLIDKLLLYNISNLTELQFSLRLEKYGNCERFLNSLYNNGFLCTNWPQLALPSRLSRQKMVLLMCLFLYHFLSMRYWR